jgi:hypothetical protein
VVAFAFGLIHGLDLGRARAPYAIGGIAIFWVMVRIAAF